MANYVNTAVTVTITITDDAGTVSDPDTLLAYLRDPGNVETIYTYNTTGTWTRASAGVYTFAFTPDRAGVWKVGVTAEDSTFAAVNTVSVNVITLRPFD